VLSLVLDYPRMTAGYSKNLLFGLKTFYGCFFDTVSRLLNLRRVYGPFLLWDEGRLQDRGVVRKSNEVVCAGGNNGAGSPWVPRLEVVVVYIE